MTDFNGYAAQAAGEKLVPFRFQRRTPDAHDVTVDILYCGVCHSDLHMVDNAWGYSLFPMVPGHEIIGRVVAVGEAVTRFKIGELAGIGTIVDSCRRCQNCRGHLEHFCAEIPTQTYSTPGRKGEPVTFGGYSDGYIVDEAYALKVREGVDLAGTAPLLCAGITTYSPLRHWKIGSGHRVGIVGLGGLGHVAVRFARALGAHVTVLTTTPAKAADAERFGADEVILSTDAAQMAGNAGRFDFILDTVSGQHDLNQYLALLKTDATMCLVGIPPEPAQVAVMSLANGRKRLAGSGVGGMAETQMMLDFAAKHGIVADVELIPLENVNLAFDRLRRNDVRYRFAIDMKRRI
jgi:uncharacterized zinc-type alcohol dehydrogenase-like protein